MSEPGRGHIGMLMTEREYVRPFEKHVAESKWQFCNCQTCQDHRFYLQARSEKTIDFSTFRLDRDERY
jgi:hypothetical protein